MTLKKEAIEMWSRECVDDLRNRAMIFPQEWLELCALAVKGLALPPEGREQEAWDKAIEIAAVHVDLQHVVWDEAGISACALLDLIAKNIRAFKGKQHLGSLPQDGGWRQCCRGQAPVEDCRDCPNKPNPSSAAEESRKETK